MATIERDPAYIAGQTKALRKLLRFTQENLADAANLTTRTIEKVESGRHMPEEQTLRSIARAAGVDLSWFTKPTPEEEVRNKAAIETARKRTDVVPISPVISVADFLAAFRDTQACRFDMSAVTDDVAAKQASYINDWVDDVMLAWSDFTASDQFACGEEFLSLCRDLKGQGYVCFAGRHKERLHGMVANLSVVCLLPKEQRDETRYALIQMEGGWEKVE